MLNAFTLVFTYSLFCWLTQGATIIGKTTCEDMCFSGASYWTQKGPVRNPHNKDYSAGGSSSGCGVVVATGECDMAIG